ncbi:MAG: hypothetical protein ACE5GV_17090, partial [Candidatus Scalindua sp.]
CYLDKLIALIFAAHITQASAAKGLRALNMLFQMSFERAENQSKKPAPLCPLKALLAACSVAMA